MDRGFKVRALGEIAIRCRDMGAMISFYRDTLGLAMIPGGHRDGIAFFGLGESYGGHTAVLALFQAGPSQDPVTGGGSSLHHLALAVDAAEQDAAVQYLEREGLPCRVEEFGWIGWRGVFTQDPEGNTVELVARTGPGTDVGAPGSVRAGPAA
ncbi:MAG: VOC family protein [Pseudomonadota bacterium]